MHWQLECHILFGIIVRYAGYDTGIPPYKFDARSRCHSLIRLRWDGDSSFILFFARRMTEPGARTSP